MKDSFYSSFENKHRGSRESIKKRLDVYMPFIKPIKDVYPGDTILDLGCGRGEWLEMMQAIGFNSMGIDHDKGMLSCCQDLGLNVKISDAISFLGGITSKSVAVVSSFHLVEHLSFYQIQLLVKESLRILKPGGLLIIETPNPENIIVSTNNFYLDPTHVAPIPIALFSFLVGYTGFARNKILRLQEDKNLSAKEDIQIIDILGGVSPDYSIIAQKQGEPAIHELLNVAFTDHSNNGIGLQELSTKYHQKINKLLMIRDNKISNLDHSIEQLKLMVKQENNEIKDHLEKVYSSMSWKLTKPFRSITNIMNYCIKLTTKNSFNDYLIGIKRYINRQLIKYVKQLINILICNPRLKTITLKIISKMRLLGYVKQILDKLRRQSSCNLQKKNFNIEYILPPKASIIYEILKKNKSSTRPRNDECA